MSKETRAAFDLKKDERESLNAITYVMVKDSPDKDDQLY
jgi:hypothetical protein